MTREEKLQFIAEMEQEERAQAVEGYAAYAERQGKLPPSGTSTEDTERRAEWYRHNRPKGVWLERR